METNSSSGRSPNTLLESWKVTCLPTSKMQYPTRRSVPCVATMQHSYSQLHTQPYILIALYKQYFWNIHIGFCYSLRRRACCPCPGNGVELLTYLCNPIGIRSCCLAYTGTILWDSMRFQTCFSPKKTHQLTLITLTRKAISIIMNFISSSSSFHSFLAERINNHPTIK